MADTFNPLGGSPNVLSPGDIAHGIQFLLRLLLNDEADGNAITDARNEARKKYTAFWITTFTGVEKTSTYNIKHSWVKEEEDPTDDEKKIWVINHDHCPPLRLITMDRLYFLIWYFMWNSKPHTDIDFSKSRRSVMTTSEEEVIAIRAANKRQTIDALVRECTRHMGTPNPTKFVADRFTLPDSPPESVKSIVPCNSDGSEFTVDKVASNPLQSQVNEIWNTVITAEIIKSPAPPKHISRPTPQSSTTVITPFRTADSLVGMYTSSSTLVDFARNLVLDSADAVKINRYSSTVELQTVTHVIASRIIVKQNPSTGNLFVDYVHPCISADYLLIHMLRRCDTKAAYFVGYFTKVIGMCKNTLSASKFDDGSHFSTTKFSIEDAREAKRVALETYYNEKKNARDWGDKTSEEYHKNEAACYSKHVARPAKVLTAALKKISEFDAIITEFAAIRQELFAEAASHNAMTLNTYSDETVPRLPPRLTAYGAYSTRMIPILSYPSYEQFVTNPVDNSQFNGTNADRCIMRRTYMANCMSHVSQDEFSGECECDAQGFMFMARLMLAISAFNRIIDTAGFQSNILSKMQLTAPIAQRYASSFAYVDIMMTDYVNMIEMTAKREMDLLVRRNEAEDRDSRRYVQTASEIVGHSGLTVLREDNSSLQITVMDILSQLSPFKSHFPPFLHFMLFLSTCTQPVHDYICAILSQDPAPERNGRSKMNFARGEAQRDCYERLYRYIASQVRDGNPILSILLTPDYNKSNAKSHSPLENAQRLATIEARFTQK